jgi:hypothetical protein
MRTAAGAQAAHEAGAIADLFIACADTCPDMRTAAYNALLESLRHQCIRKIVAELRVDTTAPQLRDHYLAAKPERKMEVWGGVPVSGVEYLLACAIEEAKQSDKAAAPPESAQLASLASKPLLALLALAQVPTCPKRRAISMQP